MNTGANNSDQILSVFDSATVHTIIDHINNDLISYKKIKKKVDKREADRLIIKIVSSINTIVDELNSLDDNFKCIGVYQRSESKTSISSWNTFNLSNYFVNKDGIVITKTKIVKTYNNIYFLKPIDKKNVCRFSKKELTDYIFSR